MTLGQIIHEYREAHNMSMATFADRSGMSKAYIGVLEKGVHPNTGKPIAPSIDTIKNAAFAPQKIAPRMAVRGAFSGKSEI